MNLSISAWPNVLKFLLRNLVSLEAPAPKTGPPDGVQAKVKVKVGSPSPSSSCRDKTPTYSAFCI